MAFASMNGVCTTCAQSGSYCLACGQPIKGTYLEFDGIGPYCQACCRDRPACGLCSAPLTDQQWQLSDGRVMCAPCYSTAIFAPGDAVALYEEMKTAVINVLGLRLNVPTGLALVDRNQLADVIRQQTMPLPPSPRSNRLQARSSRPLQNTDQVQSSGAGNDAMVGKPGDVPSLSLLNGADELDPQRTLGIYARRGMRRAIYVQTGLPRILFLQVAAHEYAHAWQGENCPILHRALVHEGFAEWVAYRVLEHYGYKRGRELMLARTDIYGQGLRWALEVEGRQGLAGLIDACRRST